MHALNRDCPLTCLRLLLSTAACNRLWHGCPGPHPTIGDVVDLHASRELAGIPNTGPIRIREIENCLTRAGLIGDDSQPAGNPDAPADSGQPPPIPQGWSGITGPRSMRTGLFTG